MRARRLEIGVLLVGIILISVAFVTLGSGSRGDDADPSSTSNGRGGSLALYTWLTKLGFQTSRVEGSFDLSGLDVLYILEPSTITADQATQLLDFANAGGDIILADDGSGAAQLLSDLGVSASYLGADGTAHNVIPLDDSDRVHDVPVSNVAEVGGPGAVPLLSLNNSPVAVDVRHGAGHIDIVGSAMPFTNDGLRKDNSSLFALTLLERARGGNVGFDEFHHGASGRAAGFQLGFLLVFNGPLGTASGLAVLLIVVVLAVNGRRLGPARSVRDVAQVPSATDHVRSLARLFERSGDRGEVARRYGVELKQRICELTGVDWRLGDAEFVDALHGSAPNRVTELAGLLERCAALAMARPSGSALLSLARDVVALEGTWATPASVLSQPRGNCARLLPFGGAQCRS